MTQKFLVPPQVEAADNHEADVRVKRRSFIKHSGGATVATLVAYNLAAGQALANTEGSEGSGSGSSIFSFCLYQVAASPNSHPSYTSNLTWDGITVRGAMTCSPAGGPSASKILTICASGWVTSDYPASQVETPILVCAGEINQDDCQFEGILAPNPPATQTQLVSSDVDDNINSVGTGNITERQWFITCEVTDYGTSSHDSYIQTKIYITRRTTVTPVTLHVKGSSTESFVKSGDIIQNLWTWKA